MKGNEFIKMMYKDIETVTENKDTLTAVVSIMDKLVDPEQEIEPNNKNPQEAYKKLYDYAFKNKKGKAYCMTPQIAEQIIKDYLQITDIVKKKIEIIDLEDIL